MHFQQLFATARRWGKADPPRLEHVWFGKILGEGGKPFKTREGGAPKLKGLLDEAEERAARILAEKEKGAALPLDERAAVARAVGIGAIKYADLGQNRNLDYIFSWDKLLAFEGNTAPYLQNAYVRTRSIFRKANLSSPPDPARLELAAQAEIELAKRLLGFADSIELAAAECRPHYLCAYLFELASLFHKFWETCPVLAEGVTPAARDSRLVLCDVTGRTLKIGLNLLGIETVERM
jgi:arginyl-tRNA synthetase